MTENDLRWAMTFLERTVARGETETQMVLRLHSIFRERLARTSITPPTPSDALASDRLSA